MKPTAAHGKRRVKPSAAAARTTTTARTPNHDRSAQ